MQLRDHLKSGKDADRIVEGVRQSLEYMKTLEPEIRIVVKECYGVAVRAGFGVMLAILSFSALSSCKFQPFFLFFKVGKAADFCCFRVC